MAEFQALKKPNSVSLEEIILEKEKVESGVYPKTEVFEISFEGQTAGPFWQGDLQDFLNANTDFSPEAEVREFGSDKWSPLFEHPLFQRRKPKLISTQTLETKENESFHLLREGQKWGPFNTHELKQMLEQKEIIITDMVSIDNGLSWGRLYEVEDFDRRTVDNEDLPHMPEVDVFEHSFDEAENNLKSSPKGSEETEAIVGLAYIGQLKSGRVEKTVKEVQESNSEMHSFKDNNETLGWTHKAVLAFSIVALAVVLFSWPDNKDKEIVTENAAVKEVEKQKTVKTKSNKNSTVANRKKSSVKPFKASRKPAFKARKPRKSVSSRIPFSKSNSFKKAKPKAFVDQRADDDFYYDNGDSPVEQDPVRSKISKETLDPEFDPEYEDEILNEDRGIASEGGAEFAEDEFAENNPEGFDEELPLDDQFPEEEF